MQLDSVPSDWAFNLAASLTENFEVHGTPQWFFIKAVLDKKTLCTGCFDQVLGAEMLPTLLV